MRAILCRLLLLAAGITAACGGEGESPADAAAAYTAPADLSYTRFQETSAAHRLRFVDVTAEAGIRFSHVTGAFGEKWMPETNGSGGALFDYDGDGHLDVLLVNGRDWPGRPVTKERATPGLYRNRGNGTFEDVTEAAGLAHSLYGMGVTAGDYDADGDLDLFLTALGPNLLLRNDGGRFTDQTAAAALAGSTWQDDAGAVHYDWSTSAAWVDVDRDGWLDLFVANYVQWSAETDIFTTMDGTTKSYATPRPYRGTSCRLYRNLGNGRFEDITEAAGIYNPEAKALGVALADLEDDGWIDIVVTNDTQPNFLFHNQGDGTFVEEALMAGVGYDPEGRARAGMGVDVAVQGDESLTTIAIGNFSREPVSLYRQVASRGNAFLDMAGKCRVIEPTLLSLTFGLLFFDADLDGWQDLVLANGHIEPEINNVQKEIQYAQRPQFLRNTGDDTFMDVSAEAGPAFEKPVVGRGLAAGDLDADGDLDLLLTTNGGAPSLIRNDTETGEGLTLRLQGKAPNLDAIGAKVIVRSGAGWQQRMVRTGSSYLSHSDAALVIGTGGATRADAVVIRWPDGEEETLTDLATGSRYHIVQGRGVVHAEPYRSAPVPQ